MLTVKTGIFGFERLGERFAVFVQFNQERFVNALIAAFEQFLAERPALGARQIVSKFGERVVCNGFAGKEPVNFRKLFGIRVIGVAESFDNTAQCVADIGFVTAIENVKLIKICQNSERCFVAPTVTDGLKIIFNRSEIAMRLFCLNKKSNVAEIWQQEKGIIGAALRTRFISFNFDFLLVRIFLRVVVYVPTKRDEKFINEIFAGLGF